MADYFVLFSEEVTGLSDAEIAWIQHELQGFEGTNDYDPGDPDCEKEFVPDTIREEDPNIWHTSDYWPDFEWQVEQEKEGTWSLWLYSDGWGNVENVALFMQAFLRKFNPEKKFTLTYASTCSKLRVGEFGGGWCVVSVDKIKFGSTWGAVQEELNNG